MSIEFSISYKIDKCRDCIHVTNSSIEHDCAFTSAPYPIIWYCKKNNNRMIYDEYIIDHRCPYIK